MLWGTAHPMCSRIASLRGGSLQRNVACHMAVWRRSHDSGPARRAEAVAVASVGARRHPGWTPVAMLQTGAAANSPPPPPSSANNMSGGDPSKMVEPSPLSSGMTAGAAFRAVAGESTTLNKAGLLQALRFMHPQFTRDSVAELRDDLVAILDPEKTQITKDEFIQSHDRLSNTIDKRIWPIAASTALIGSAVGVIIPSMPMLAAQLDIGPAEYGLVIGGLALTKLLGNIPASNAADKYGRKKILVNGIVVLAVSNIVIGLANNMEVLLAGRLMTGIGVAMFVTSSALYSTDVSNALNRARTMAPIGIAFSVGATLGPAIGGVLTSAIGISNTFYLVGATFGALALLTRYTLSETLKVKVGREYSSYTEATTQELHEWRELMRNKDIRSTVWYNMMYWVAFSGCQMTLLPLILMDDKFGLGPAGIGMVFMGSSLVNVIFAQPAATLADRFGKPNVFLPAGFLVAGSFFAFPLASNLVEASLVLGTAAVGNAMLGSTPTAHVADCAVPEMRSKALALLRTSGDVGMLIGSASAGMLAGLLESKGAAMEANAMFFGVVTAGFVVRELAARRAMRAALAQRENNPDKCN
eukprot:m.23151 g.23151  ORF g.23151 m.23151 type:complete len:586 (+) comp4058_c0_seq2:327-2084(+)